MQHAEMEWNQSGRLKEQLSNNRNSTNSYLIPFGSLSGRVIKTDVNVSRVLREKIFTPGYYASRNDVLYIYVSL